MAEMLALAKALNVPAEQAASLFDHFNPGMTIGPRMKRMVDANFADASWELTMARKDARLMMEEGAHGHVPLTMLPAIAARMDALILSGHGAEDWTVIAKEFVR
jgi:3-hydroxyisobutyrate dehydrogenase